MKKARAVTIGCHRLAQPSGEHLTWTSAARIASLGEGSYTPPEDQRRTVSPASGGHDSDDLAMVFRGTYQTSLYQRSDPY